MSTENQGQPLISERGKRAAEILGMSDIEGERFVNAADETMAKLAPLPRPLEQKQWTVARTTEFCWIEIDGKQEAGPIPKEFSGVLRIIADAHTTSLRALQEALYQAEEEVRMMKLTELRETSDLKNELSRAQEDTKRLDWVRTRRIWHHWFPPSIQAHGLRAAIDAALSEATPESGYSVSDGGNSDASRVSLEKQIESLLAACKAKDLALEHCRQRPHEHNPSPDWIGPTICDVIDRALALQPNSSVKPEQK